MSDSHTLEREYLNFLENIKICVWRERHFVQQFVGHLCSKLLHYLNADSTLEVNP